MLVMIKSRQDEEEEKEYEVLDKNTFKVLRIVLEC